MTRVTLATFILTAIVVISLASGAEAQDDFKTPAVGADPCVDTGADTQVRPYERRFEKGQPTPARDEDDHVLVLELGAVVDWEHAEGSLHGGGTVAIEVTPIENRLELEIGVTAVAADRVVEIPIDVLFKKPWRFSRTFEFMIGAGPEVVFESSPFHAPFWGVEAVLDFMFWIRKNIGWYVEPGYEITFRDGTSHHGLGIAAGLLVGR